MTLTLYILISSLIINAALLLRIQLMKQNLSHKGKLLDGALVEKDRLRGIIIKSKIQQN
jgi:hypothetical protein